MLTVRMASPMEQDACVPSTSGQPHPLTPKSPVRHKGFEFLSTDEETVALPPTPRSASQAARLRDVLGSDLEGWSWNLSWQVRNFCLLVLRVIVFIALCVRVELELTRYC